MSEEIMDNIQATQAVNIVSVQIQLGEIKGILQTVVAEHARRLTGLDDTVKQLRTDLVSIKESSSHDLAALRDNTQIKWDEAAKQGNSELIRINKDLTTLEGGIKENREDIKEIREKSNRIWPTMLSAISTLSALGIFVITVLFRH